MSPRLAMWTIWSVGASLVALGLAAAVSYAAGAEHVWPGLLAGAGVGLTVSGIGLVRMRKEER